uniref:Cytochrome P450 n=1 Tax=uncultured bacterium BAC-AB1442/1414/561 TaxID=1562172 RepID=A0A0C4S490_9BACT|nr:cytochrome P450 [uncultured bacterium BAC-AB1442/1414/561]
MTASAVGSLGEDYRPNELSADPYPFYARARREEPVFYGPAIDAYVATTFQDVRTVLADPETYSLAAVLRPLEQLAPEARAEIDGSVPVLPADHGDPGDEARRRAAEATRIAFARSDVDVQAEHLRSVVYTLIDRFLMDGPGDVMSRLARALPVYGKAKTLGIEPEDVPAVVEGSYSLTYLMSGANSLGIDQQVQAARRVAAYQRLLDRYAQSRHAEPRDDLVTAIVAAVTPQDGSFPVAARRTVIESLTGLIGAGQNTTTAMIGTALWQLLSHPRQLELLRQRPELTPGAVEELTRFDMPLQGLFRQTTRPVRLGDKDIPSGARIMVLFASANRDEKVFDRPDELDITRKPKRHMSYGHGPRSCVGSYLARQLLQYTIGGLVTRIPGLELAGPPEFVPGMHRIIHRLDVRW